MMLFLTRTGTSRAADAMHALLWLTTVSRWKKDGGSWTEAFMTNYFVDIDSDGAQISFADTVGHTTGQWWSFTTSASNDTVSTATLQSTVREWGLCSNRGVCNDETGSCTCFDNWGMTADACVRCKCCACSLVLIRLCRRGYWVCRCQQRGISGRQHAGWLDEIHKRQLHRERAAHLE